MAYVLTQNRADFKSLFKNNVRKAWDINCFIKEISLSYRNQSNDLQSIGLQIDGLVSI